MARTNPRASKTIGAAEPKSKAKAEIAHKTADAHQQQVVDESGWPRNPDGAPMAKIEMTSAELIPTGQFANISVGPAKITCFIDPFSDTPFTDAQKANMGKALNELADVVEMDVIAVHRNLVHESLQDQIAADSK